jgi:hypothetical protein
MVNIKDKFPTKSKLDDCCKKRIKEKLTQLKAFSNAKNAEHAQKTIYRTRLLTVGQDQEDLIEKNLS